MDRLQEKINLYVKRTQLGESIKWTELYDTEQDMIQDLMKSSRNVKGNEYTESFKRQLNAGQSLTKSELTQLKRISKFIFADVNKL